MHRRCVEQRSAEALRALGQHHTVPAQGRHACRLQTGRATTCHQHAARAHGGRDRQFRFPPHLCVHGAVHVGIEGRDQHRIDAVLATEAAAYAPHIPGTQLVGQLGIGEQRPRHHHQIRAALGKDALGLIGIMDAPHHHHRHIDHPPDRTRHRHVVAVAVARAAHDLPDDLVVRDAATHLYGAYTGLDQQRGDLLRVLQFATVPGVFIARDAQRDRERRAHALTDVADNLEQEAGAPFDCSARVDVLAAVTGGAEKGAEQHVSVRGMEFHAVVTGLLRTAGGIAVERGHAQDLVCIHHAARPTGACVHVDRRAHRIGHGFGAGMADLRLDAGTERMHATHEFAVALDEPVLAQRERLRLVALRRIHRAHFNRDQPHSAGSARLVVTDQALADSKIRRAVIGGHRGHHETVAQLHPADGEGAEQSGESVHASGPKTFRPEGNIACLIGKATLTVLATTP